MSPLLLTQNSTPIIGQVAKLLGYIMSAIYNFLDLVGIPNIGLAIILFTFIVYLAMLPMTIKQQKFSKLQAKMQPEIQAVQKKYQGKKDNASMQKMQDETKLIYEKYGTSPTGGCLQLVIQMPILFALYRVIMNIPAYVTSVKAIYMPLIDKIMNVDGFQKIMESIGSESPVLISPDKFDYSKVNTLVDVLYKFQSSTWDTLVEKFPDFTDMINKTSTQISGINNFLGINIAEAPINNWKSMALLIPILAGVTQYLSVRLTSSASMNANDSNNSVASSMKTMNTVMPLMSVAFCFTMPAGLGLYWIAGAVIRSIQQVVINNHLSKMDVDELVQKNIDKVNKKREKKGLPAKTIRDNATVSVKNIQEPKVQKTAEQKMEEQKKASDYYNTDAKPGSLASKASMVKKYNEGQKK